MKWHFLVHSIHVEIRIGDMQCRKLVCPCFQVFAFKCTRSTAKRFQIFIWCRAYECVLFWLRDTERDVMSLWSSRNTSMSKSLNIWSCQYSLSGADDVVGSGGSFAPPFTMMSMLRDFVIDITRLYSDLQQIPCFCQSKGLSAFESGYQGSRGDLVVLRGVGDGSSGLERASWSLLH